MDVVDEPRDEQKEIKENEADAPADVKQEHEPEPLQEQDQAQAQAQAQEQTQEQAQPQSQEQDAPPASELAASSTEDVVLPSGEAPEQATEPQPSALSTASSLAADLSPGTMKPRWVLICFAITFCVYVALIPQLLVYSNPPTGDQVFYLMDVASIAQDLDLNIKNNYDNVDETKFYQLAPKPDGYVGMNGPYPLPRQLADSIRPIDTEQYAFHLPGLAVLLAPAWKIGSFFSLWWPATIVVLCIIGALVATNVFLLAYEVTNRHWIAWAVWLSLAFTVPIMTFSYMIFTELPMGLLVIYAFRRLALGWGSNSLWRLLLIGVCIGYIPWMAWRGLPLVFTLLVYAAIQWWRYRRALRVDAAAQTVGGDLTPIVPVENTTLPVRRPTPAISKRNNSGSILSTAWLLVPIGISAVILGSYHMFLYNRLTPDTKVPELGDLLPFHWPWAGLDEAANFAKGAFAIFFDKQFGLLMYAPIYLLAVVGIIAMFRSAQPTHRNLLWGMALVVLPYLGVIMAFEFWHGIWCPPARYLATLVPFAGGPLAVS